MAPFNRLLKNVMSAGQTRPNLTKKRRLCSINEHFEEYFTPYGQAQLFCNSLDKTRQASSSVACQLLVFLLQPTVAHFHAA